MSFDIYVMTGGERFDRSIVERAFGDAALNTDSDIWGLCYKDGSESLVDIDVGTDLQIDGFSASRPPASLEFWAPVFEVLRATRTFLVWPATGPAPTWCVANTDCETMCHQT